MAFMRRAMQYLGLGPDDEYDDYDTYADDPYNEEPAVITRPVATAGHMPTTGTVRAVPTQPGPRSVPNPASARPGPRPNQRDPREHRDERPRNFEQEPVTGGTSTVRAVAQALPQRGVSTITVESFNDAQEIGDRFKSNQPVIVNLQGVDRDLMRRIIDFGSGVVYVLGGHMERITDKVYLLTPANAEVSAEERKRLRDRDYAE
jgi:cell division inhibitor SepF